LLCRVSLVASRHVKYNQPPVLQWQVDLLKALAGAGFGEYLTSPLYLSGLTDAIPRKIGIDEVGKGRR
jgi:hypothetical protein